MESEGRIGKNIVLEACPVADGKAPCGRSCGGGWPGTGATTENLTKALHNGGVDPDKLGCGPLIERARAAVSELTDTQE
jgi:hypothetical protein